MDNTKPTEEVSVREVFGLFLLLLQKTKTTLLKIVVFIIKHAIPLALLLAIGIAWGLYTKKQNPHNIRVLVISASEHSGSYLEYAFDELNYKLQLNNSEFKSQLGLEDIDTGTVEFRITPIHDKGVRMHQNEYQYLNYLVENKIMDREQTAKMFDFGNHSYQIEMIYPKTHNGEQILQASLDYIRNTPYAKELHKAVLEDINLQIEENNRLIVNLGKYIENLGDIKSEYKSDNDGLIIEGSPDIGAMMYARIEVQSMHKYLVANKVKLEENFRVLNPGRTSTYYGEGLKDKKQIVYPIYLIFSYLVLVFIFNLVKQALVLKREQKA